MFHMAACYLHANLLQICMTRMLFSCRLNSSFLYPETFLGGFGKGYGGYGGGYGLTLSWLAERTYLRMIFRYTMMMNFKALPI